MTTHTQSAETKSYFTEPGNGWRISGTEHQDSTGHALALEAAKAAGFGPLVLDVVAGQCKKCLEMLEPLAQTA